MSPEQSIQENLFLQKIFKFLIGGGITTCFNLVLIFLLIDRWGWDTPLLRNIANAVSIELSVLLSFFIYRIWIWTGELQIKEVILKQIPLFHLAAGTTIAARIFLIFPLLDYFRVDPKINTLAGGLVGAALNFVMSDRLVFKENHPDEQPAPYSEELEVS